MSTTAVVRFEDMEVISRFETCITFQGWLVHTAITGLLDLRQCVFTASGMIQVEGCHSAKRKTKGTAERNNT